MLFAKATTCSAAAAAAAVSQLLSTLLMTLSLLLLLLLQHVGTEFYIDRHGHMLKGVGVAQVSAYSLQLLFTKSHAIHKHTALCSEQRLPSSELALAFCRTVSWCCSNLHTARCVT
jgi:hypothetical protein